MLCLMMKEGEYLTIGEDIVVQVFPDSKSGAICKAASRSCILKYWESPRVFMFFAALTSLLWTVPQPGQNIPWVISTCPTMAIWPTRPTG